MITRDFLLRQIHQFVQALARVLFLRSARQYEQALREIDETLRSLPDLDILLQPGLNREEVEGLCAAESDLAAEKALALADLLRERAFLLDEQGKAAKPSFQYALWLYEIALSSPNAAVPLDIYERIAALKEEIRQF